MKTTRVLLISALCVAQAHSFTLPRQPTKSYECSVCSQLSHENLHDKWELSDSTLNHEVSNMQKSYGYKERISLEQLRAGVAVTTLAPGAVIRITPLQNKSVPQLMLKTPANKLLSLKDASSLYSQDEELGESMLSSNHQTMLQIKPELGAGKFIVKGKDFNSTNADAYMISVLDKFSSTFLQVETDSLHYQYGDTVNATITLEDYVNYDIYDINATLIGPDSQVIPLKISKIKHNQFAASTVLNSETNDHGENWYIEVDTQSENGQEILKRGGHTAFSYSVPSASLLNVKKLSSSPLTFVATLDVATASRYALQTVLFRKNGLGEPKPIETSQRAQWLEPGKQVIQFTFDNAHQLSEDNLYIGYLRLIDYGQLKTVYQYDAPIKLTQLVE